MSLSTPITPAILDTVLGHLAPHFLTATNGDAQSARDAARSLLESYDARTEEELQLATDIVGFGFHALEALSAAAAPDLSLNQKLRLRGSAVSLSREGHKARRKLDQLKRARVSGSAQPQHAAETAQPRAQSQATSPEEKALNEKAAGLIEFAKEALEGSIKPGGLKGWNRQQRRAAEQIAENLRRNAAKQQRRAAAAAIAQANVALPLQPARLPSHV
jgi:hypothetical protein